MTLVSVCLHLLCSAGTDFSAQCVGMLMGCAVRTRALMPLALPSLFWKPIVGLDVNVADLEAVTQSLVRGVIQPLRECTSEEEFTRVFGFGNLRWY
jgi:hypothetical protein